MRQEEAISFRIHTLLQKYTICAGVEEVPLRNRFVFALIIITIVILDLFQDLKKYPN